MLGLLATFAFAAAGCIGAAVIATSLRNALPSVRRLAAERRALAEDRAYLFTLIETSRHADAVAPAMVKVAVVDEVAAPAPLRAAVGTPVKRRAQVLAPVSPARLYAAA